MRVLVIEDQVDLATAMRDGLALDGYEVELAFDGEEGLWRAQEGSYAVIVLDLMLPKMNGYLLCRTLREGGDRTPILMLTAKDGEWDEVEGLDTGADDYIKKPFSLVTLAARIRALQRRGEIARPAVMEAGWIRLDPATRECTVHGDAVPLTRREYALLDHLMRCRDRVVSRDELMDRVWGRDFNGSAAVLDVYVGYLRSKLDRPPGDSFLITIRGVGYRLNFDD